MAVIPYETLDPRQLHAATVTRLLEMPPGLVISAGQSGSGKLTILLALALRAQRSDQRVVLFTDQEAHYAPFDPLPPRWERCQVGQSSAAWSAALAARAGTDDLLVVAPMHLDNAGAVLRAAQAGWVFATVETALAGLDLSYVLRGMGIGYAEFADTVRSVWSIFLLPAICDHCGRTLVLSPQEGELLAPGAALGPVKVEAGCEHCLHRGTDGFVSLLDITLVPPERRAEVREALVKGVECHVGPDLHIAAHDEARSHLAQGVIGLNTYREAIQRNPLLRAQHALQVVQAQADKLAQSLWLDLAVLTAVADNIATAVLVIDEAGKVRFCNALGRGAIQSSDELAIQNESIHAKTPRIMRQLTAALGQAVQPVPRATRIALPRARTGQADIFVTPLPAARGYAREMRPLALVLVGRRGTSQALPSERDLRQLFDLTTAESKVALMLCAERSPKEIAFDLGLSITTVRSQVSSLLAKTGTSRQLQLVALLTSLPRTEPAAAAT